MRSRLELSPNQRFFLTVVGGALLYWGWGLEGKGRVGPGRFFGTLAAVGLILYVAGGGRAPWKISWKDYLLYVAISVALVAGIILYASIQLHRGR